MKANRRRAENNQESISRTGRGEWRGENGIAENYDFEFGAPELVQGRTVPDPACGHPRAEIGSNLTYFVPEHPAADSYLLRGLLSGTGPERRSQKHTRTKKLGHTFSKCRELAELPPDGFEGRTVWGDTARSPSPRAFEASQFRPKV